MRGGRKRSQSATRKLTLIALGALVAGTVFLLPRFVSEPWIAGGTEDLAPIPESSPANIAPSTAAELARYRQDSQSVLAEIVRLRDRLLQSQVELWAGAEFQQALGLVETGDERYSYGDYAASLDHFKQARLQMTAIEQLGERKLAESKAQAAEAIESLNPMVAESAVGLALAIAPDDPEAQALSARRDALGEVAESIRAGDDAMARGKPQEALDHYRRAVNADPLHQRAASSLSDADRAVTESTYRNLMSRGLAAMERGEFEQARTAFRAAGRVSPGDAAVTDALAQVDNLESGQQVQSGLERAAQLESREAWREAVAEYEDLLGQDPSLSDARVRLIPARVRADLDDRLQAYIDDPLRLSAQADFLAAQTAVTDAQGIPDPGPRLAGQIARLQELLRIANSPVDVVFRSDNRTRVTLFRVAELGQFEQKSVKLRPGKYVVAGTRSGYRDVRVEFTVTGAPMDGPIVVQCEEPVG